MDADEEAHSEESRRESVASNWESLSRKEKRRLLKKGKRSQKRREQVQKNKIAGQEKQEQGDTAVLREQQTDMQRNQALGDINQSQEDSDEEKYRRELEENERRWIQRNLELDAEHERKRATSENLQMCREENYQRNVVKVRLKEEMKQLLSRRKPNPKASSNVDDRKDDSSNQGSISGAFAFELANIGTEMDMVNCPFYLKTGSCRFADKCGRKHPYIPVSHTLLFKNMYDGINLREIDKDGDEGLEYDEREVMQHFTTFYEDVYPEFAGIGHVSQFKVCRNNAPHLRGNVYVQYESLEDAMRAYQTFHGRYYAGRPLMAEFTAITKWNVAICGLSFRGVCPKGKQCNFLHVFRNPDGRSEDTNRRGNERHREELRINEEREQREQRRHREKPRSRSREKNERKRSSMADRDRRNERSRSRSPDRRRESSNKRSRSESRSRSRSTENHRRRRERRHRSRSRSRSRERKREKRKSGKSKQQDKDENDFSDRYKPDLSDADE